MPTAPLTFTRGEAIGLEPLAGQPALAVNCLADAGGALHRMAGLAAWTGFPSESPVESEVIGVTTWQDKVVFITADRYVWTVAIDGSARALSTTDTATQLEGHSRPTFAYDRLRLVIAGGGAPLKWEGGPLCSVLGGSPPDATHVAALAQRFIALRITDGGLFDWSDEGEGAHETWDALSFAEAEARPDKAVALYDNTNELFVFGTETTQVFVPDASLDFAVAATVTVGCSAPYSPVALDDSFLWLDERRRFVVSNGRSVSILSAPNIAADLERFGTVSDCWGGRVSDRGREFVYWKFPTEGRTFAYDIAAKSWAERRSFPITLAAAEAEATTVSVATLDSGEAAS